MHSDFTDLDLLSHISGENIIACQYKTKKPTGNWKYRQTTAQTLEEYEKMKQENPLSNWGIITGKIPRGAL
jgi:hypothetical protein